MATSTTGKISGTHVKCTLPSDDHKNTKIKLKIDSEYTQIGDKNKVIDPTGLDTIRSRIEPQDIPSVRAEFESESGTHQPILIQARFVQIDTGNNEVEITINSDKASSVQIGDRCTLNIVGDERETAVKKDDTSTLGCCSLPCELFPEDDVVAGNVKSQSRHQPKRRRKKLQNRTDETKKKTVKQEVINKAWTTETSEECIKLCEQFFEQVQKILHPLRDNGNWCTFDDKWNEFKLSYGSDPVWKALLELEYGIRICYHSQFDSYLDKAEKRLYKGRKIILNDIVDPSVKQFCEGRLNCYLISVYRRMKKYGRAEKCLEISERNFESSDFLYDKATLFYEKGSLFHEFDKNGADNESAKKSFEKCYELCMQLKIQKGWDFIKKGQFAQLKKALLLLGCSTKQGRKRRIRDEDLNEANKCIEEFDRETKKQHIPIGEKLQLLLAKSDQCFRKQDLVQAKEFAVQAAKLADEHGFNSRPANKRLQDIEDRETSREANHTPQNNEKNKENLNVVAKTTVEGLSGDADGSANQSTGNSDDEDDSM